MATTIADLQHLIIDRTHALPQAVASEMLTRLTARSPVDTGLFVNNWNVGLGVPDLSTGTAVDPGRSQARIRGNAIIARAQPGQTIHITNSLPYARRLEYGWSAQAPSGVVAITVAEAGQIIEQATRTIAHGQRT